MSQSTHATVSKPAANRIITAINISVRDLDRAISFYRDVVGFPLMFSDAGFHYARFGAGGITFGVVPVSRSQRAWKARQNVTPESVLALPTWTPRTRSSSAKASDLRRRQRSNLGAATWQSSPIRTETCFISIVCRERASLRSPKAKEKMGK